jgi:hypothetical protein
MEPEEDEHVPDLAAAAAIAAECEAFLNQRARYDSSSVSFPPSLTLPLSQSQEPAKKGKAKVGRSSSMPDVDIGKLLREKAEREAEKASQAAAAQLAKEQAEEDAALVEAQLSQEAAGDAGVRTLHEREARTLGGLAGASALRPGHEGPAAHAPAFVRPPPPSPTPLSAPSLVPSLSLAPSLTSSPTSAPTLPAIPTLAASLSPMPSTEGTLAPSSSTAPSASPTTTTTLTTSAAPTFSQAFTPDRKRTRLNTSH